MKKRIMMIGIILMVLAMLATAGVTLAKAVSFHQITGHNYSMVEAWGDIEI